MKNWPPDSVGTAVRTISTLGPARDYTAEAKARRRPGVDGVVVGHSDGHGLCYEVRHSDGSRAYYDPEELLNTDGSPLSHSVVVHEVMNR